MNTVCKRLITFVIGVPLVICFVFMDFCNHLPLNLLVILFSILGAIEFSNLTSKFYSTFPKALLVIFSAFLPFSTYILSLTPVSLDAIPWFFVFETIILMGGECLTAKTFENSLKKLSISFLEIFYCGLLFTFVVKLTTFEYSKYIISLFFILVFMTDSAAWFFGILFGKNNRGIVAASPNKSVIGFAGGIFTALVLGCLYKFIFPEIFTGSYIKILAISLLTSISSIIGDLIESVFKRSLEAKDSGNLIPGRGGVLDSVDSIIVSAPVFYVGIYFLYNF